VWRELANTNCILPDCMRAALSGLFTSCPISIRAKIRIGNTFFKAAIENRMPVTVIALPLTRDNVIGEAIKCSLIKWDSASCHKSAISRLFFLSIMWAIYE
jgi:hypothetical protein